MTLNTAEATEISLAMQKEKQIRNTHMNIFLEINLAKTNE